MDIYMILLSVAIVLIFIYSYSLWNTIIFFKNAGIPYLWPFPIVGNIGPSIFKIKQIGEVVRNIYNQFPEAKYLGFHDCMTPTLMIRDPELVRSISIKNFDHFTDHYGFTTDADPLFNDTLFQLRGHRWRSMRNLLSPTFTANKLKNNFHVISKCATGFVSDLIESMTNNRKDVNMKSIASRYTNDIICKIAFGIDINSSKNPKNDIYRIGKRTFSFVGPLSSRFLLLKNFPWIAKILKITLFDYESTTFFTKIIDNVITTRDEKGITQQDMLQLLLNNMNNENSKVKVDMDAIMSQTFVFFLASFETTSTHLSFAVHALATNPEVQLKLQAEVDKVFDETKGEPTYEAIQNMEYMKLFLKEIGRMYAPLAFLDRVCTKKFELPPALPELKPYVVEPGTNIYLPVFALQRDPKYYSEPEKFNPDRFLKDNISNDPGVYLPFGAGPRICIGLRLAMIMMKLMLFHLLIRCNIKPISKTILSSKLDASNFIVNLRDYWIEFEKRHER